VKPEDGTEASTPLHRIDDAFAYFCKKPVGTSAEDLIGMEALVAIQKSAEASAKRFWFRCVVYTLGGMIIAGSLVLAFTPLPAFATTLFALLGIFVCGATWRNQLRNEEPTLRTLTAGANADHARNIHLLEEFRTLLAGGKFKMSQRRPDGSWKDFDADLRASFAADHGRLLIVSDDPAQWIRIRRSPVPRSDIWVSLGGRVGSPFISARTLIDTSDAALFERHFQWLLRAASGENSEAVNFRHNLNLIAAFRRDEIRNLNWEDKKTALEKEGHSRSVIEKMHAGNYASFERFLHKLPLSEMA
jgi:hypothetical protein